MNLTVEPYGEWQDERVQMYTLNNDHGMQLTCINYGCIITSIRVPDRHGNVENVVLGMKNLSDYVANSLYFGAVCGRVAGRVKHGRFNLEGRTYQLAQNEGRHHLHGGHLGFDKVLWTAQPQLTAAEASVEFKRISPDGEEGYPGNLEMSVTYTLTTENQLRIRYHAVTDRTTIVNVTNHTYFNLSGNVKRRILEHKLQLHSDQFLELDDELIPTGKLLNVDGTPFDFRRGRKLMSGLVSGHTQNVLVGRGYDHPFLIKRMGEEPQIVLSEKESGRLLRITTDDPCVVIYTGNSLPEYVQLDGATCTKYLGLCLETQGVPDAVHHPQFPSIVLERDQVYSKQTTYAFSTC